MGWQTQHSWYGRFPPMMVGPLPGNVFHAWFVWDINYSWSPGHPWDGASAVSFQRPREGGGYVTNVQALPGSIDPSTAKRQTRAYAAAVGGQWAGERDGQVCVNGRSDFVQGIGLGMNDDGFVVGTTEDGRAFVREPSGSYHYLGHGEARAINNRKITIADQNGAESEHPSPQIVGHSGGRAVMWEKQPPSENPEAPFAAWMWTQVDLTDHIAPESLLALTEANSVSDTGMITGKASNPSDVECGFVLYPVELAREVEGTFVEVTVAPSETPIPDVEIKSHSVSGNQATLTGTVKDVIAEAAENASGSEPVLKINGQEVSLTSQRDGEFSFTTNPIEIGIGKNVLTLWAENVIGGVGYDSVIIEKDETNANVTDGPASRLNEARLHAIVVPSVISSGPETVQIATKDYSGVQFTRTLTRDLNLDPINPDRLISQPFILARVPNSKTPTDLVALTPEIPVLFIETGGKIEAQLSDFLSNQTALSVETSGVDVISPAPNQLVDVGNTQNITSDLTIRVAGLIETQTFEVMLRDNDPDTDDVNVSSQFNDSWNGETGEFVVSGLSLSPGFNEIEIKCKDQDANPFIRTACSFHFQSSTDDRILVYDIPSERHVNHQGLEIKDGEFWIKSTDATADLPLLSEALKRSDAQVVGFLHVSEEDFDEADKRFFLVRGPPGRLFEAIDTLYNEVGQPYIARGNKTRSDTGNSPELEAALSELENNTSINAVEKSIRRQYLLDSYVLFNAFNDFVPTTDPVGEFENFGHATVTEIMGADNFIEIARSPEVQYETSRIRKLIKLFSPEVDHYLIYKYVRPFQSLIEVVNNGHTKQELFIAKEEIWFGSTVHFDRGKTEGKFRNVITLDKEETNIFWWDEERNEMELAFMLIAYISNSDGFKVWYEGERNGVAAAIQERNRILRREIDNIAQTMEDTIYLGGEIAVSIAFEPADWVFTIRDISEGEYLSGIITIIPFVPGAAVKGLKILDGAGAVISRSKPMADNIHDWRPGDDYLRIYGDVEDQDVVDAARKLTDGSGSENSLPKIFGNWAGIDALATFAGRSVTAYRTRTDLKVYRVFDNNKASVRGKFWSLDEPVSRSQVIKDLALGDEDAPFQAATFYVEVILPPGSLIYLGQAAKQTDEFAGGGSQVFLSDEVLDAIPTYMGLDNWEDLEILQRLTTPE